MVVAGDPMGGDGVDEEEIIPHLSRYAPGVGIAAEFQSRGVAPGERRCRVLSSESAGVLSDWFNNSAVLSSGFGVTLKLRGLGVKAQQHVIGVKTMVDIHLQLVSLGDTVPHHSRKRAF